MSCQPPYDYRPFTRPVRNAIAPTFPEHRSRLFAGGTYFRSLDQKQSRNEISLEITIDPIGGLQGDLTLTVRYKEDIVETYPEGSEDDINQGYNMSMMTCTGGAINKLRGYVNGRSEYIEMYARGADIVYDLLGMDASCLGTFSETYMSGGNGAPEDGATISSINTGKERTMIIITSTEQEDGVEIQTPPDRRAHQWNGDDWISYVNLKQGQCPIGG